MLHVLWFEFRLSLRRLIRRKRQSGLMLATFTVSLALSLVGWSLFRLMFLGQPEFDPKGEYLVLTYADAIPASGKHSSRAEIEAYKADKDLYADFAELGLYSPIYVRTPAGQERFLAAFMSARALQVVGAKPLLGRLFTPEDDQLGSTRLALLSQRVWENNFGRDPAIVGKTMETTSGAVVVVGVMPASFRFPDDQDLWFSYGWRGDGRDALVKLRPGVDRGRAERDLQLIQTGLGPESPANKNGLRLALKPLRDCYLPADLKVSAAILFGLSLLFVVVSCANAANLMLIDFLGRRPEVAASLALGVPRVAAIRSICFQIAMVATVAALLAVAILPAAGPLLASGLHVPNAPFWLKYTFVWDDVGVALALAALSALVTAAAPVGYLLWSNAERVIREHATSSRGTGRARWRRLLLTAQISLLTVLGISAGLLARSNYHVGEKHWGYAAAHVFMGSVSNLVIRINSQQRLDLDRRVIEQVEARPETAAAAFAEKAPGYSGAPNGTYATDPAAFSRHAEVGEASNLRVSERFFETLEVPFIAGQVFPRDNPAGGPNYVVINASLAAKLWPGQDPLQRTLYVRLNGSADTDPPLQLTVCGVVRDFQVNGPLAKTNDCLFRPFVADEEVHSVIYLLVRDRAGWPSMGSLTAAVHRAEPRLTLYFPTTLGTVIDMTLSSVRLTTHLTALFAVAAALLCAIGVYSLTVAQVLQSSRDFGIRMALGALPRWLWLQFARGHLANALVGVAIGIIGAAQVARVLGSLLYGVDPHSAATYAGVAAMILVIAALACLPSLFRLQRINPADCLRSL